MKKLAILFITLTIIIGACGKKQVFYQIKGETQGTSYSIMYEGKHDELKDEVDSVLHEFDKSLSTYIPESVISQINRGNEVKTEDRNYLC
jgi:thiamine biosynthesis lipoprotein